MERLLTAWLFVVEQGITSGDSLSQLLGRWIFVRIDGKWDWYTLDANESVSGASNRHAEAGRWPWVEKAIDAPFRLFGQEGHCRKARESDKRRAIELLLRNGLVVLDQNAQEVSP